METDDALQTWLPLIGSTVFIGFLSSIPLPLLLLLPIIAAMTYAMQEQVFHTRSLAKTFWLTTYLRPESPIRQFLVGVSLLRWIAIAISIPLAIVTYITVYSYDLWDCFAVAVGIYVARLVHQPCPSTDFCTD